MGVSYTQKKNTFTSQFNRHRGAQYIDNHVVSTCHIAVKKRSVEGGEEVRAIIQLHKNSEAYRD